MNSHYIIARRDHHYHRLRDIELRIDELTRRLGGLKPPYRSDYSRGLLSRYIEFDRLLGLELHRISTLKSQQREDHRLEYQEALRQHRENEERLRQLQKLLLAGDELPDTDRLATDATVTARQFTIPNCKGSQYFNSPYLQSGVVHVMRDGGCEIPWDQGWRNVERFFAGHSGKLKASTLIKFLELLD